MAKTENIIFRCSEDLKNAIQAKLQDTNMSISEYVTSLIQMDLSHNEPTPLSAADRIIGGLHFSLPERFGVVMYAGGREYPLYPVQAGRRLTDDFLDQLLLQKGDTADFAFLSCPDGGNCITLSFSEDGLKIFEEKNNGKCYDFISIRLQEFRAAFLAHVKKYAIYFEAPYNYQAIMLRPFDEMVKKMQRYQPKAGQIISRIDEGL